MVPRGMNYDLKGIACAESRVCTAVQPAVYGRRHIAFSIEATVVGKHDRYKFSNDFRKKQGKKNHYVNQYIRETPSMV